MPEPRTYDKRHEDWVAYCEAWHDSLVRDFRTKSTDELHEIRESRRAKDIESAITRDAIDEILDERMRACERRSALNVRFATLGYPTSMKAGSAISPSTPIGSDTKDGTPILGFAPNASSLTQPATNPV